MSQFDQKQYTRLKTRLTTKINKFNKAKAGSDDAEIVKAGKALQVETSEALSTFADSGYPDDWHRWERAKEDAQYFISRHSGSIKKSIW